MCWEKACTVFVHPLINVGQLLRGLRLHVVYMHVHVHAHVHALWELIACLGQWSADQSLSMEFFGGSTYHDRLWKSVQCVYLNLVLSQAWWGSVLVITD